MAGSNVSDIGREQQALSRQIEELESLRRTLEESNRNIDAYFESQSIAGSRSHTISREWYRILILRNC